RAILEEPAGPAHGDGRLQSRGSRGGANAEGESETAPRHHGPRGPVALTTETQHPWSEGGDAGDRVGRHGEAARTHRICGGEPVPPERESRTAVAEERPRPARAHPTSRLRTGEHDRH